MSNFGQWNPFLLVVRTVTINGIPFLTIDAECNPSHKALQPF